MSVDMFGDNPGGQALFAQHQARAEAEIAAAERTPRPVIGEKYRITWEMVNQAALPKYFNADPRFYSNATQIIPNSRIPDEDWHEIRRETTDPWDQYRQLKAWADAGEQFVRNVRLEKATTEPVWVPVTDHDATEGHQ